MLITRAEMLFSEILYPGLLPTPTSTARKQSAGVQVGDGCSKQECEPGLRSRIPNNTGSRSRIFCPNPDAQLDHFFYITLPNREFLLKWCNFFWNFCWNGGLLPVRHDFHWLLFAAKLLTAKLHSLCVEESQSGILEWSDILPPTPQPWFEQYSQLRGRVNQHVT